MRKILAALLCVTALAAHAETQTFTDLKAYDGDTIRSTLTPIKGLKPLSFRLKGIDTPELRGKCESEKANAIRARDFLNAEIVGKPVTVEFLDWDKYGGRVITRVSGPDGIDVTQKLIAAGLGRPYNGGFKTSWCK